MGLFGKRRRPPAWLFGLVGAIVMVGFAVATFQIWSNDNALRDRGVQAPAQVVEVRQGKANRTSVEFRTADGQQVRSLIGQGDSAVDDPKVGDRLDIVYDPQDPQADVKDTRAGENHTFAYVTLAATILTAVAVPLVVRKLARDERRSKAGTGS